MRIQQKEIKRRTFLVLFGLLPLLLFILGFYLIVTIDIGIIGFLFYIPMWINLIVSWFFKSEKYISIFERIPEKVKLGFFVIMLICILGVAPLLGVFSIINFEVDGFSFVFTLQEDISLLLIGGLLIGCSCVFWIMVLYALDIFRSIRFYVSRYSLLVIGMILFLFLFTKYNETSDILYLIMGFLALMLCVGTIARRNLVFG